MVTLLTFVWFWVNEKEGLRTLVRLDLKKKCLLHENGNEAIAVFLPFAIIWLTDNLHHWNDTAQHSHTYWCFFASAHSQHAIAGIGNMVHCCINEALQGRHRHHCLAGNTPTIVELKKSSKCRKFLVHQTESTQKERESIIEVCNFIVLHPTR